MTDYSCVQMAVGDICKCDYAQLRYFSFCTFSIEYTNKLNSEQIWKKLRARQIVHFTVFLKKVFEIDICEWQLESNKWQNCIEGLKMRKNILLGFDCYYAPWSPSYLQTHILHFCHVKGVDEAGNLICTDSYMNAFDVSWGREEFEKAYKAGYYVTVGPGQKRINNKEILSWIKNAVPVDSVEIHYKNLLKDFLKIRNYEDLFETENPEACELIIVTKQISRNYSEGAKILKEWDKDIESDKLEMLRENYQCLSDNWNMITQLLLYMILRRKIIQEALDSIQKYIEKNLICEIEILKLLEEILE